MPFGAHESVEVHEILSEKINMISHFNFYSTQTQNPRLRDMIMRHQQEEVKTYNAIVGYTHDYSQFSGISPNIEINSVTPNQIQYGLNNPAMVVPETNAVFNDFEVANALLQCHKNAAANGVRASLEIADPNLRQMLLNSAVNCVNQAYEVFLFMNQQGMYQVPELKDHTAKTFLHRFQPAGGTMNPAYNIHSEQSMSSANTQQHMIARQSGAQLMGNSEVLTSGQGPGLQAQGANTAENLPIAGMGISPIGNPANVHHYSSNQQINH